MRKFTKGLLLTFIASAMSVGSYAQETTQQDPEGTVSKYYRIVNAGYQADPDRGTGVMYISEPTTAQPQKTADEAVTLPGTVMWLKYFPMSSIPEEIGHFEDVSAEDFEVSNLRSQGVDAEEAIYGPLVSQLRTEFTRGLKGLNKPEAYGGYGWGFTDAEIDEIIDQMFDLMKMFLAPAGEINGQKAYYLKSTTPSTQPLIDALNEKGISTQFGDMSATEWAWFELIKKALAYYDELPVDQLEKEWEYFAYLQYVKTRIHMGHTYYLIGGRVETDLATYQRHDKGPKKGEFLSFANNNKDYKFIDQNTGKTARPEIEVAGDFAKWILREVVTKEEAKEDKALDYFAVEGAVLGGNFESDGKQHYYTTLYTDFPMDIIPNDNGEKVKVYTFYGAPTVLEGQTFDGKPVAGYVKAEEITGTIPARVPIVVECVKAARESNPLLPVLTPKTDVIHGEPNLKGIFFEEFFDVSENTGEEVFDYHYMPLEEATPIARKLVRVFNRSANNTNNPMGFYKFSGSSIKPNKAFMILDSSMAEANIYIVDEETFNALGIDEIAPVAKENNTIYDIQGRVVTNPTKGLYIVNGKKMVIK